MYIIPLIFICLPMYALFIYFFWLRIQQSIYNIKHGSIKTILMWLNELFFTTALPIIGFIMINEGDFGSFNEVNNNALFKIPESLENTFFIISLLGIISYSFLRLVSYKKNYLSLINKLLVFPLTICLFTVIWIGVSLGYGLLPIFITLPVISPLISSFYILLLIKENSTDNQLSKSDVIDEHLLHTNI